MKRISTLIPLLLFCICVFGQSKQSGFVKEYSENSKKKPMAGVELLVSNAGRDVTRKDGDFHLEFLTLKPGDPIHVQQIIKAGYEIFNKDQLDVWRISNNGEPFTILLCKSSKFKALKDEYNAIAFKSYDKQRAAELEKLDCLYQEGKIQKEKYEKEKITICNYYDDKLNNLDNYIDRFARIDLGEISREERRIVELVRKGMIQEAIMEYDALKLDELLIKNYSEYQKADSAASELVRISAKKKAYEENLLSSLENKYNLMVMGGSFDAVEEILNEYETIAERCPHSLLIIRGLVEFANKEGDAKRVAKWGRVLLEILPDSPILKQQYNAYVSHAESILGNIDQYQLYKERSYEWLMKSLESDPSAALFNHISYKLTSMIDMLTFENGFTKCVQEMESTLQLLDSLHRVNSTDDMNYVYYLGKHHVYSTMVEVHLRQQDLPKAFQCQEISHKYLDSLSMVDTSLYVKKLQIDSYDQYGYLCTLAQDFLKAEQYLSEAKTILLTIEGESSYTLFSVKMSNYTNFANVYFYQGEIEKCLQTQEEALSYAESILDTHPYPMFFTNYAEMLNNHGYICFIVGDESKAEEAFRKSIEQTKPFAEKNPFTYTASLCTPQINLGTLLLKQGRWEEFSSLQDAYWTNVEKVADWLGLNYSSSYAIAWDNKGYYELIHNNDEESAKNAWQKIKELVPEYLEINPVSLLYPELVKRNIVKQD